MPTARSLKKLLNLFRPFTATKKLIVFGSLAVTLGIIGITIAVHLNSQPAGQTTPEAILFSKPQAPGPLLTTYRAEVAAALASDQPIIKLPDLGTSQSQAQDAAVAHDDMQAAAHDPTSGQPLQSQVFQAYDLPSAQATGQLAGCANTLKCYIVEIYFFATNSTGKVIVGINQNPSDAPAGVANPDDIASGPRVLSSSVTTHMQPELPPSLTAITKEIISGSQELKDTLHTTVDVGKLTMVNGKTALKATRCERSEHLCVAPTLALNKDAYWIIVDMTDARIVGVTWTKWNGSVPDVPPSEQAVIDAAITQKYCGVDNGYEANGWKFTYSLTGSDGVEVKNVSYKGTELIASAKNPDWHVSYSHQAGFGYSDAVGCPVFSTAAVVPAIAPYFDDLHDADGNKIGFELVQEFKSKLWPQPCNYYYQQRFEFFNDGSFRPAVVNLGRGCGDDGTYRPVTRIQPATSFTSIDRWNGDSSQWQSVKQETWEKDSADNQLPESPDGFRYRLNGTAGSLEFALGRGQFNDGGHGDNAWTFLDRFHPDKDEGASDLATLGSCCNTDSRQGPDVYTTNESLTNAPLLLWYVSEQKNNGTPGQEYCWADASVVDGDYKTTTYPCVSGPLLTFNPKPGKP